jgi:hypothetical protein
MIKNLDSIEYDLKNYFFDTHNQSLSRLSIEERPDHRKYKFSFENDNAHLNILDICLYDYYENHELMIKLFGHSSKVELQYSLMNLFDILKNEVIPNFFPELYLSLTFKPTSFPDFYNRMKEIKNI